MDEINRAVAQYNMIGEGIVEQGLPIPDADKPLVIGMMAAGDIAGLENYFQQNPLTNVADAKLKDSVLEIAKMNNSLADLHNASGRDISPDVFESALDTISQQQAQVSQTLQTAYQSPAMRNNIRYIDRDFEEASRNAATLNSILASLGTRNDGNGVWANGIPNDDIWNLYVPGLPQGNFYPFNQGILSGTGGVGSFSYQQESVVDAVGFPVSSDRPVADTFSGGYSDNSILIENPKENGGAISFLLDKRTLHLSAGEAREFTTSSKSLIQFDPGDSSASKSYSLKPGQSFKFVILDGAWDLRERVVEVTIDNSTNEHDFLYVADNEVVRVPAGEERVHSSSRPIEIRFDRGDGDEGGKLLESGRYSVAVNVDSLKWDLHQQEKIHWSNPVTDYQ